jgi:hypothetical protein
MKRALLVIGLVGAAATGFGFTVDKKQAFFSYLAAWNALNSVALGALILLCICYAMGAVWPIAIRGVLEAIVKTIPLLALLFLPILFGLDELYPFMHPERITHQLTRHMLEHKRPWLNAPFFIGRSIGYLAIWSVLAIAVTRRRSTALASGVLPLLALTLTFASFDWLMALSPYWKSTIFGVYYFAGGFVAALALVIVLVAAARRNGLLTELSRSHFYALGRLLFGFVVFWAYIAFFQFFLIWIANKPNEAAWYLERTRGGFRWVSWFLGIGHFAIPFFLLLPYWTKQRIERLLPIAIWILFAHLLDVHWLIAPARHAEHAFSWMDFSSLAALIGLTSAFAIFRLRRLAATDDPEWERALAYQSQ